MSALSHEAVCLDSLQNRLFFFDDFEGDQLKDEWVDAGTGSVAVIDLQMGGIIRLTSGALLNQFHNISWGDIRSLHVDKRVTMEIRLKVNQTTYVSATPSLRFDADNNIAFNAYDDTGAAVNWKILCEDGGIRTIEDSGVAFDTDYHIFRTEVHLHGGSHAHFYIDNVECNNSPIATHVPDDAGDYLQPRVNISTKENVAKTMDVDYVYIRQDR